MAEGKELEPGAIDADDLEDLRQRVASLIARIDAELARRSATASQSPEDAP